jgi:hypothetical protein
MEELGRASVRESDEIDLLALFTSVAKTWKVVLIALFLVALSYLTFMVSSAFVGAGSDVRYSKVLRLTFDGASTGVYPNGATFGRGDIIAPNVVEVVFESLELERFITPNEFKRALSAQSYAPGYKAIHARYERLMSNKKITPEKVAELSDKLQRELLQAGRGSVEIGLTIAEGQIPAVVISDILYKIPEVWAEQSIRDKGVLDLNMPLSSGKSYDVGLFEQVDYMVISDLLNEKVNLIEKNVELLSAVEGAATIEDPETGLRLEDLSQALKDLQRYVIDELMSPIRSLGLTREAALSIYYYEEKGRKLQEDKKMLSEQADLVKQALDAYYTESDTAPVAGGTGYGGAMGVMPARMSADAVTSIIEMAGQGRKESYRQELTEKWLDLKSQAAEVDRSYREVANLVAALSGEQQTEMAQDLKAQYLSRAEEMLPSIVGRLGDYFDVTQRIYQLMSAEAVGMTDKLYAPLTHEVFVDDGSEGEVKRHLLTLMALLFLTLMVVVPSAMIRNAMKARQ